jgi:ketosteroid isomerase-like protein
MAAMRFWLIWCLALSGAAAAPRDEIITLLQRQQAAWNRGDLPAFMMAYENSPDLLFVGNEVTRGYGPTLERYRRRYPTRATMGTLTFSGLEVHEAGPGAAWVYGQFALEREAAGGGAARGRFTLVLRKTAGGWKIVMDHTSS